MGEKERATFRDLCRAVATVPEGIQQWILGYAEGRASVMEELQKQSAGEQSGTAEA